MPTTPTPAWMSNRDTLTSDPSGSMGSDDLNQYLGTHAGNIIYQGKSVLTPNGTGGAPWFLVLGRADIDQPFTMSGTTIGRVSIPVLPVGIGADLLVSLCANNAGVPGTVIQQTLIPQEWIYALSAVSALPGSSFVSPTINYTGNPLGTAQFNDFFMGSNVSVSWPFPTTGTGGANTATSSTFYSNYIIMAGGTSGGAATSGVYTITYDTTGVLGPAIPQQSLPAPDDGSAVMTVATDPSTGAATVVYTGGSTTAGGSPINKVYTTTLNTITGNLTSWSAQTNMPTAVQNHAMASYNGYVYVIGGGTGGGGLSYSVSYAQVQNGQISSWAQTTPLPSSVPTTVFMWAGVSNGFLFVFGGFDGTNGQTDAWYAPILSSGAIGAWSPAPPVPTTVYVTDGIPAMQADQSGLMAVANGSFVSLAVSEFGPDTGWQTATYTGSGVILGLASGGNGTWQYYAAANAQYTTMPIDLTPRISVPLPATSLTNGATYHILIQQQGGDLNNYLRMHADFNVFPGNPIGLSSARAAFTWSNILNNMAVPLQIFDQSALALPLHTWEDSGTRISTIVRTGTPDLSIIGLCESTLQPAPPVNQTWNFNNGLGQWTATGGTIALSTAHVYQQLSQSALLTPSGAAAQSFLSGDLAPVLLGHTYSGAIVCFSTVGYASVSVNINWYTSVGGALTPTSGTVSAIPANTWTRFAVAASPPATAAYGQIVAMESGTPPASALLYVATGALTDHQGVPQASVTQITYGNSWPTPVGPPVSLVQLA